MVCSSLFGRIFVMVFRVYVFGDCFNSKGFGCIGVSFLLDLVLFVVCLVRCLVLCLASSSVSTMASAAVNVFKVLWFVMLVLFLVGRLVFGCICLLLMFLLSIDFNCFFCFLLMKKGLSVRFYMRIERSSLSVMIKFFCVFIVRYYIGLWCVLSVSRGLNLLVF